MDRLDFAASRLSELATARLPGTRRRLTRFTDRVGRLGERLTGLGDQELRYQVRANRDLLRTEGLIEPHVAMAFALIREASRRVLGMRHYDEQLIAGRVLLHGMVAEMETGEGKTLMATLPAATAALAGVPVHVITVNDYLVERDARKLAPLYAFLGLGVGVVREGMGDDARRRAYAADITYCTNKQVAFDYLRDRVLLRTGGGRLSLQAERIAGPRARLERAVMRGLCFAIVDEADSVLIDEAGTPLILSREGQAGAGEQQRYRTAMTLADKLQEGVDYHVSRGEGGITLGAQGRTWLGTLADGLDGEWALAARREELVCQALTAMHLFRRDHEYLVADGRVAIIDDLTGRVMADRKWQRGLHQMIEIKEGCETSAPGEVQARISYQCFFRRYLHLCGMTGTARETAGELLSVYSLRVRAIPTHRPGRLRGTGESVYTTRDGKWQRIVERVAELRAQGRPVLVGTRSVAESEQLAGRLAAADIACQVLNARQDMDEAALVARAGRAGTITIATNMAGRGTDIPLAESVAEAGGLHVIAAERNAARRIDRQLFGRAGRHGEPGSYETICSLDDQLACDYLPKFIRCIAARFGGERCRLPWPAGALVARFCQYRSENAQRRRRRLLELLEEYIARTLAFTGIGE